MIENIKQMLAKWKTDFEVNKNNYKHEYRLGYVCAMNDCINLIKRSQNEQRKKEVQDKVLIPTRKCVFFSLKDEKYITENGIEITTDMLVKYQHQITENWSFIILD